MKNLVCAGQVSGQVEAHAPKAAPPTTPTAANPIEFDGIIQQAWLNSYKLRAKEQLEGGAR